MKVIVIGAGVGGASTAIALRKLGHDVVVYDKMRENRPVGAALSLWPNGVKVLNWLGLSQEVAALGGDMASMSYIEGHSGRALCRFSLAPVAERTGQKPYPVARTDLQALLMERVGLENIHLGKRLIGVEDDGRTVIAHFEDGSRDTADLLIGADGAHSIVRDYVTEGRSTPVRRTYCGYTNFNGLVAADERIGGLDEWTTYVAEGKRAAVMPVAQGRFYFWFDVPQPSGIAYDRSDGIAPLRSAFGGWAPGVQTLLSAIDPEVSLNRVEIWDIDPFHTWVRGRVAILGDAAHNTAPDIGQGACSALEDSFALAISLATNTVSVNDSLLRYQQARSARAADLVLRARKRGHETHAFDPEATQAWYRSLDGADGDAIIGGIISNVTDSPVNLRSSSLSR